MHLLITGGMGFVGKNLLDYIFADPERDATLSRVTVVDHLKRYRDVPEFDIYRHTKVNFVQADLCDPKVNLHYTQEVDVVVHLAAATSVVKSVDHPDLTILNNVDSTVNLLEACRKNGVKRFVFASTAAAKGQVDSDTGRVVYNPYGLSKRANEMTVSMFGDLYGLDYIILRFYNLYGPYQYQGDSTRNVVGNLVYAYLNDTAFRLYGDGRQTRDFVYVEDLSRVIFESVVRQDVSNVTIEVGKGSSQTVNELIETFQQVTGRQLKVEMLPARKGEIVDSGITDQSVACSNLLECQPTIKLAAGLQKTLDWIETKYK